MIVIIIFFFAIYVIDCFRIQKVWDEIIEWEKSLINLYENGSNENFYAYCTSDETQALVNNILRTTGEIKSSCIGWFPPLNAHIEVTELQEDNIRKVIENAVAYGVAGKTMVMFYYYTKNRVIWNTHYFWIDQIKFFLYYGVVICAIVFAGFLIYKKRGKTEGDNNAAS